MATPVHISPGVLISVNKPIRFAAALFTILAVSIPRESSARSLILTGVGTLSSSSSPVGQPGEGITVTVELHSDEFAYVPVANQSFHLFTPIRDVPVSVVGELTGSFTNVAPISDFTALELTSEPNVVDQIGLRTSAGNTTTSLVKFFCATSDCFDGDVTPFNSEQLLDLFEEAVSDPVKWNVSTALSAVFAGPNSDLTTLGVLEWSITDPSDPTTTLSIEPTIDVQVTPGAIYSIEEGSESLTVGQGFSADFPEQQVLMEFPLDSIPAGATIESVSLQLDPFVSSGAPRVEVWGYSGDGLASLSDVDPTGEVLAVTGPTSVSTGFDNQLDAAFVQSLLGASSHLGLRLRSLDLPEYFGFDALEETFPLSVPPTLTITYQQLATPPGDLNDNGTVDAADYTVWRDGLGGQFTLADYDEWKNNFGATAGSLRAESSPTPATVPEPRGLVLCLLAAAVFLSRGVLSRVFR